MDTRDADAQVPLNTAVAAVLRAEQKALKLTLADVAERTGIPRVSVQRYLAGTSSIDVDTLGALAPALGLTLVEVLTAAESRRRRSSVAAVEAAASVTASIGVDTTPVPARPAHGRTPAPRGAAGARGRGRRGK